jgi:excinuclease ABC subunit A
MVDQVLALPEGSRLMLLAPVVDGRKGEHKHVLQSLMTGGFVRARIDGIVVDLDSPPDLDKKRKHTIEAVVDRFRVRADMAQRLAESFETALGLTDGIAAVVPLDDDGDQAPMLFSSRFACPVCGYALTELEPRMFSFNNPAGACEDCDGLGVKQFFDPDRVVHDPHLSLAEGAIRGWDRRSVYYFHLLQSVANHYGFDVEAPFGDLTRKQREAVLHGSGKEKIDFSYVNDRGDVISRRHAFEGVLPNMDRRYRETESQMVRENLTRYLSTSACPGCEGSRLRRESRHVFVAGEPLHVLCGLSVDAAYRHFASLDLDGPAGPDRRQDPEGDPCAAEVPRRRGPRLSDAVAQCRYALRRRSPAHPPGQPDRCRPRRGHVHPRRTVDRPAPARQRRGC